MLDLAIGVWGVAPAGCGAEPRDFFYDLNSVRLYLIRILMILRV